MSDSSREPLPTDQEIAQRTSDMMRAPPLMVREIRASPEDAEAIWLTATKQERRDAVDYQGGGIPERERRLRWLRKDPKRIAAMRVYYADHLADFIDDWGMTIDPRLVAEQRDPLLAFTLWAKQRELIAYILERWAMNKPGVVVKSRDVGASWVAMALLGSLCTFRKDFAAGIASATEIKLDRSGDPDTLFFKLRAFLEYLPEEFRGGWEREKHSAYMRISFPETGSSVTGEAGDQAGRGGRKSIYIVDEAAHFEHPKLIDASLAATTNCRIDMSSVNGTGNSFADKARNPDFAPFFFTWRDDPRKSQAWYDALDIDDTTKRQEYGCDFTANQEGACIPREHVDACVGLDERLGLTATGGPRAALDVADRGKDKNAFAWGHGCSLEGVESWSGKTMDIYATTQKAFDLCDEHGIEGFDYDADGMGAGVRGDARVINEHRTKDKHPGSGQPTTQAIWVREYRGSGEVSSPEKIVPRTNRKAKDYYLNRKAQAWKSMAFRCAESLKASKGLPFDKNNYLSINPKMRELALLLDELSQVVVKQTGSGKLQIDKTPDDNASPNLADAVVMAFAPTKSALPPMGPILDAMQGR
jgi:phage terminase large subunit